MKYKIMILFFLAAYTAGAVMTDFYGKITDTENEKPLGWVNVSIPELKLMTYSDENGIFKFDSLRSGEYMIVFSRIGYRKENRKILIKPFSDDSIVFKMVPVGVKAPAVVVTGEKYDSKFLELTGHKSILQGKELQKDMGQTLASTLKEEAGIAVRAMGPAPARPVIRGLSGNRISITEDGNPSNDMSATSPDHAVAIEPALAEKIEVIRGPAILKRSTNTIGGIVNVVTNDVPEIMSDKVNLSGGAFFESANMGRQGFLEMDAPLSSVTVKGDLSYKKADNIHSPGKILKNTSLNTLDFGFGGGYFNESYTLGASYREFSSDYGIPGGFVGAHPNGVKIKMLKRNYHVKFLKELHEGILHNMEVNLVRSYYRHTEYESTGSIGAEFTIREYLANLDIIQDKNDIFDYGSFGISMNYKDNKIGGYVFTPQTKTYNAAAYLFEEFSLGSYRFQAGGRYAFDQYDPYNEFQSTIGFIRKRNFSSLGLSFSGLKRISGAYTAGFDISLSSRPPTVEELYSQGPHLAAYSYETGNPDLETERGFGFELFSNYKNDNVHFTLNAFWNEMPYFIVPRNTGKINYNTLLPVYETTGVYARLVGFEGSFKYNIMEDLLLNGNVSYTYGEIVDEKSPLPMIPPLKSNINITYEKMDYNFGIKVEMASAQDRVDKFETPTAGYIIYGTFGQYMFYTGNIVNNISLVVDNIFNTIYRNHLSRIKSIMPEPGTNIRFVYKVFM